MSLTEWALLLHILAAMVWVGGVLTLGALASHIARGGERGAVARFVGGLRLMGLFVFAPAVILLFAMGVWLVVDSDRWSFGQTWIWLALMLFAGAFLIGAVFQSRAAVSAERAIQAGDEEAAINHLRKWALGSRLILVLLIVATWDMVFKPGL